MTLQQRRVGDGGCSPVIAGRHVKRAVICTLQTMVLLAGATELLTDTISAIVNTNLSRILTLNPTMFDFCVSLLVCLCITACWEIYRDVK